MSTCQTMNLPVHIPWCLIGASEDMMDRRSGADRYPAPWRSSIAVYAYEPPPETLAQYPTDRRITYLKITTSVTGYQPTAYERSRARLDGEVTVNLDDSSTERDPADEYYPCYGAHLNITVMPLRLARLRWELGGDDLDAYPRIIAFEPKKRDLYQAVTETNEVLTGSNSEFSTDKSLTTTTSMEMGVNAGLAPGAASEATGALGSLTGKWGKQTQDATVTSQDYSREKRESEGSTTSLNQLYTLLSGLHEGTNRVAVTWFPNPNQLVVSDRRTFPRQVPAMEGIQDVVCIVQRPADQPLLGLEISLDTGHYPENPRLIFPERQYDRRTESYSYRRELSAYPGWDITREDSFETNKRTVLLSSELEEGWQLDVSRSIQANRNPSDNTGSTLADGTSRLIDHQIEWDDPDGFHIEGTLRVDSDSGDTVYNRTYEVPIRRPSDDYAVPEADVSDLLVAHRELSLAVRVPDGGGCPTGWPIEDPFEVDDTSDELLAARAGRLPTSIVDERRISMPPGLVTDALRGRSPEALRSFGRELVQRTRVAMVTSAQNPDRYPAGLVGLYETRHYARRLKESLSADRRARTLESLLIEDHVPEDLVAVLGEVPEPVARLTVEEVLEIPHAILAKVFDGSFARANALRDLATGLTTARRNPSPPRALRYGSRADEEFRTAQIASSSSSSTSTTTTSDATDVEQ